METIAGTPSVLVPAFEPLETWAWEASDDEKLAWISNAFSPPADLRGPAFDAWVGGLAQSPQFQGVLHSDFRIVGFKMNPSALGETERLLHLLSELSTRLVILRRSNRIKHALSLYRYFEEEKSQFDRQGMRPPSKVKLRRFHTWVRRSQAMEDGLQVFADAARAALGAGSVLPVAYEDFVTEEGKVAVIDRVAAFLGIEPGEIARAGLEKATPDDLRAAVLNYRRLRRRYRNTPLAVHFDD